MSWGGRWEPTRAHWHSGSSGSKKRESWSAPCTRRCPHGPATPSRRREWNCSPSSMHSPVGLRLTSRRRRSLPGQSNQVAIFSRLRSSSVAVDHRSSGRRASARRMIRDNSGGTLGIETRRTRRRFVHLPRYQSHDARCLEHWAPHQTFEEHRTTSIDIRSTVHRIAENLFRRHVLWRSQSRRRRRSGPPARLAAFPPASRSRSPSP